MEVDNNRERTEIKEFVLNKFIEIRNLSFLK